MHEWFAEGMLDVQRLHVSACAEIACDGSGDGIVIALC